MSVCLKNGTSRKSDKKVKFKKYQNISKRYRYWEGRKAKTWYKEKYKQENVVINLRNEFILLVERSFLMKEVKIIFFHESK